MRKPSIRLAALLPVLSLLLSLAACGSEPKAADVHTEGDNDQVQTTPSDLETVVSDSPEPETEPKSEPEPEPEDTLSQAPTTYQTNWPSEAPSPAVTPDGSGAAPAGTEEPGVAETALPTDGDRIVLTGTVGLYTDGEIIAMQGISGDMAEALDMGETQRLIVLDTPQTLTLSSPDGSERADTVSLISVSDAPGLEQYDGQHVIFSIDPGSTFWPGGVMLPLGQPRTDDIHVLG